MNLETIIKALQSLKTLENATLEEIDKEVRKTSTCCVVDTDEIKEAGNWIGIENGQIKTFFEDVSGNLRTIECSFAKLIAKNIEAAEEKDSADQFVKDARMLAAMLEKAAKRVERDSRS